MAGLDLLTILSTDWVESTATRVRLGEDRADELQAVHDELLREAVKRAGGRVVKGSGDGVLATFDAATDALAAAVDVQQRVDRYSRRHDAIAVLELRVGISVGDVVHQDGDIFGTPVVEAVRLCASAGAGQILCSDVVRHLARGRGGFEFDVIGLLELKGLPDPVAACSVRWERAGPRPLQLELPPEMVLAAPKRFVGRRHELDAVLDLFARSDRSQAVWLFGEPGIGKTRLAVELAVRAAADGATVLFGRCDDDVGAPFQPFQQALRWYVGQLDDAALVPGLGGDPEPLARLLPELARRAPELAGGTPLPNENQQFRLFEAIRSWLTHVAAAGGVVLVVDDVHWADRPTRALLAHLIRAADAGRVLIVATARDTDPDHSDDLDQLVDDLERTTRSRRIRLAGLRLEDVLALVGDDAAGPSPFDTAARLVAQTGGNPLYLNALLHADPGAESVEVDDVHAAVRLRTRRLPAAVADLLATAALAGQEFRLRTVLAALGVPEDDGLARAEHAVRAGLVEELGVDRFRFTHGVVRDVLVDQLSASRRAHRHGALAAAIEAAGPMAIEDELRALARHHANAGGLPEHRAAAIAYAMRAGRKAMHSLAFDVAVEDFGLALDLLGEGLDGAPDRFDLLMERGTAQRLAALHPGARRTFREAAQLARARNDRHGFALAAIEFEEASWRPGEPGGEALELLMEASATGADLPPELQIRVAASRARAAHFEGRQVARPWADAALERARALGDPLVLAHSLCAALQVRADMAVDDLPHTMHRVEELWALGDQLDDLDPLGMAWQYGFSGSLTGGDRDNAERWLARGADLATRAGSRFMRTVQLTDRWFLAYIDGRLDDAERLAREELELAEQCGIDLEAGFGLQTFVVRREQDRLGELASPVRVLLASADRGRLWRPGLVLLLAELGMRDEGNEELLRLTAGRFASVPRDVMFSVALQLAAEAAHLLGNAEPAADIAELLSPWRGSAAGLGHRSMLGSADRAMGLMAELQGDLATARRMVDEAVEFHRRLRAPLLEAASLVDAARLHLRTGDRDGAVQRAGRAAALAERHGLRRTARRVAELGLF